MSGVAFYAPLKSPDHPNPSGDRQMARNLMDAVARAVARPVNLVSDLRSFDGQGRDQTQDQIFAKAKREVDALISKSDHPSLWVTYHNYYKAPDLLGPSVSAALGIPYVLIEATRAQSRMSGAWARFAAAAERASDAAEIIFHFTQNDQIALTRDKTPTQRIVELPPFLNRDDLPTSSTLTGPMLTVGMMRHKDKLASYELIAEALGQLTVSNWALDIVGDGEARNLVEALFHHFGGRVRFHGALPPDELQTIYAQAQAFIWPGVNEAFGMVYLEAQAAGLPVIAQDRPGVRDVLVPGAYPDPADGAQALAQKITTLLSEPALRTNISRAGRRYVAARHLRPNAVRILREALMPLIAEDAA